MSNRAKTRKPAKKEPPKVSKKEDPKQLLKNLETELQNSREAYSRLKQQEQTIVQSIWRIEGAIAALQQI